VPLLPLSSYSRVVIRVCTLCDMHTRVVVSHKYGNCAGPEDTTDNDAGHHDTFGLDKALQCLELSSRYRRLRLRRPVRV